MTIRKHTRTYYSDDEQGFKYSFEPVNDEVKIEKVEGGYKARYLVYDTDPQSPDEWCDGDIFLVHYHRDFWVEGRKDIITQNDNTGRER